MKINQVPVYYYIVMISICAHNNYTFNDKLNIILPKINV